MKRTLTAHEADLIQREIAYMLEQGSEGHIVTLQPEGIELVLKR